jgi:A/G-specific adenine glycosylase
VASPADTDRRSFQAGLLAWYAGSRRDLPWRGTRDPYAVLVSELMLQQTQAARVVPAWRAFLDRFPDVQALARAPLADVLTAWRGLGYNRRAVNLQRAARALVEDHGGVVPDDFDALLALPGVGPYTARAVLAFAFDRDVAPVDTNVARVLARAVANGPLPRTEVQRLADQAVPDGLGHDWNQALMDLGAAVCTARAPRCAQCPVRGACRWRTAGGQDPAGAGALRPRPQTAFAGSDRYHRGRLVDALRDRAVDQGGLPAAADLHDPPRLERIVAAVIADGVAEWAGGHLRLPGGGEPG